METFSAPEADRRAPAVKTARPRVLIPVFPGTNCEYDSARAMTDAGAEAQIMVHQQPHRGRHRPQRGALRTGAA